VDTRWTEQGVTQPSIARIYDFLLGGEHNLPVDREQAAALLAARPHARWMAQQNRAFALRAVRHVADAGVRQFLDLGSGIPAAGAVHEVAPDLRVAYLDADPDAVRIGQQLLTGSDRAIMAQGDVRSLPELLETAPVRQVLDFAQPMGILVVAVLHFLPDSAEVRRILDGLRAATAPGSYLVFSHHAPPAAAPAGGAAGGGAPGGGAPGQPAGRPGGDRSFPRSPAEILDLLAGFDVLPPGLVPVPEWRPDGSQVDDSPPPAGAGQPYGCLAVSR
jgi:hypothetical protein